MEIHESDPPISILNVLNITAIISSSIMSLSVSVQDSQHHQICDLPFATKIKLIVQNLKTSHKLLQEIRTAGTSTSLRNLKAVANMRSALSMIADRLADLVKEDGTLDLERLSSDQVLYEAAENVCTDESINYYHTGPGIFLLKLIFKQYGSTYLKALAKNKFLSWILPQHLIPSEEVGLAIL